MSSKYDRVKVKVHLGGDHYYILSRFLLSKMLAFCKLPTTAAVRVSLAVKKYFVDQNRLEIAQMELEAATFSTMAHYGYGEAYTRLFPLLTRFYMERVPLVVLIAGSGCCGKTATAHSLSAKLNTHNVVSADMLLDILSVVRDRLPVASASGNAGELSDGGTWPHPDDRALWFRETDTEAEFVRLWQSWAEAVCPLVEGEMTKALTDGKVLLLEGSLLDLSLYRSYLVPEFQRRRGAIVIAFYLSADNASRLFTVERLVSKCHAMLPAAYANDHAAAVEWMMRRLKIIEELQLKKLTEGDDGGAGLYRIDTTLSSRSAADFLAALERDGMLSVDGAGSRCAAPTVELPNADAGDVVRVHLVKYSVDKPSVPNEVMHELVLERIMTELCHR